MPVKTIVCFILLLFSRLCLAGDGGMVVNAECADARAHGSYSVAAKSGEVRITGNYTDGVRNGEFTFYDVAGNRIIELPYKNGFINGTVTAWHSANSVDAAEPALKLVSDIAGGLAIGQYQTWYADGTRRSRFKLHKGDIKSAEVWNTDGELMDLKAQSEFLSNDIEGDFRYYQQLEQVMYAFPPQC